VLHRLVEAGNTVIVIEHNLDVIMSDDWIIDLGPEGGARGGQLIGTGTPETIAAIPGSATGEYLARVLRGEPLVPLSDVSFAEASGRQPAAPRRNGRRRAPPGPAAAAPVRARATSAPAHP
jgi:excinuclease ABC subunit A